jgi:hypothetical protein
VWFGALAPKIVGYSVQQARQRMVPAFVVLVLIWILTGAPATANINIELRPASPIVTIGLDDTVGIGLYLVSDDETIQLSVGADVILTWEPEYLHLLKLDQTGAVPLLMSDFPTGNPSGLNEANPPQDGDGIYIAWSMLGSPIAVTPGGTLLTTFVFEPVNATPATPIDVPDPDDPPADTIVFDGTIPNFDVTGTITGASVEIVPCCLPDFNGDCLVNVQDFLILLAAWGTDPGGPPDLDANCTGCSMPLMAGRGPITRISVKALKRRGMEDLIKADLNHDGWLDLRDMQAFAAGARPE